MDYIYLRAWNLMANHSPHWCQASLARARRERAPTTALYHTTGITGTAGAWITLEMMTRNDTRRLVEQMALKITSVALVTAALCFAAVVGPASAASSQDERVLLLHRACASAAAAEARYTDEAYNEAKEHLMDAMSIDPATNDPVLFDDMGTLISRNASGSEESKLDALRTFTKDACQEDSAAR